MLDNETKRRIDTARDILVGKVPDPKSQVEQITIALIYKFMDDMDAEAEELGGKRKFFSGEFDRYGWKKLMAPDLGGFDVLTLYAEAIQKMNINPNIPQLFRDIFKNAYLPYRDPETLKSFLKIIDDFEYSHSEKLGDAFEYLLSVLGSQGDAGQFRTPRHIIDFMVDIIDPKKDETILDPACGTAGFLISSYKHILKHNSTNFVPEKDKEAFEQTDVSIAELSAGGIKRYSGDKLTPDERAKLSKNIKGYDISPDMVRLSLVNLYLHGFTDPKIFEYDTLTSEDNWNEYADIVLANPPFMSPKGGIKPHKRFSIQSNRSEVLFVDYMVEHLTPNGKAAIIVPEGIIFQSGNAYKQLRKMLVENYLFAVVSLPAGVFQPYSGVKTSILLIDKALNKKTDKILFVKIENDGFDLGAQRRPNNKSQLATAVKLVKEYISGCNSALEVESILTEKFGPNSLWNIATKAKIAENDDLNLSGERYKKTSIASSKYQYVELSELVDLQNGYAFKSSDYIEDSNTLNFRMSNIKPNGTVDLDYNPKYLPDDFAAKYSDYLLNDGDVVIAMTDMASDPKILGIPTIFKIYDRRKFLLNQRVGKFTQIDQEKLFIPFLKHILLNNNVKEYFKTLGGGGLQLNIGKKDLLTIKIPLPPLEIQKEIVAEIEAWQKIIDGARQVVENYKPQIDIDPEWPMVELGEVCDPQYGFTDTAKENSDVRYIRITDIGSDGELITTDPKYIELTEESSKYLLEQNDLLVARTGATYGKTMLFQENYKAVFASYLIRLRFPKDKILPRYYWIFAQSDNYWNQARNLVTGGGQPQFNGNAIKKIKIPVPNLETQQKIIKMVLEEQVIVKSTDLLVSVFEQKIKDRIAKVWGE